MYQYQASIKISWHIMVCLDGQDITHPYLHPNTVVCDGDHDNVDGNDHVDHNHCDSDSLRVQVYFSLLHSD